MTEILDGKLKGIILIIDDSESERELINEYLTSVHSGLKILQAPNGPTALQTMSHNEVDLVVLDYRLPVVDGIEVLKHLVADYKAPVIMVTGMGSQEVAVEALRIGAVEYITKSVGYHKGLPLLVERHLRRIIEEKKQNMLEAQYEVLVENSLDPIFQLRGNHFIYINRAFEQLFGYSRKGIIDTSFSSSNLLTEESIQLMEQRQEALERGEEPPNLFTFTGIAQSGDKVELETNVSYLLQPDGSYLTQGVLRRVVDRAPMAQESVRLSEGGLEKADWDELALALNNHLAYVNCNVSNIEEALELGLQLTDGVHNLLGATDEEAFQVSVSRLKPLLEESDAVFKHVTGEIKSIKQGLNRVATAIRDPRGSINTSEVNRYPCESMANQGALYSTTRGR